MHVYLFEGGWRFYDAIELMLDYRLNPYLCVCYIYICMHVYLFKGGWRFFDAIELMLGYRINPYLWFCLSILTPLCSIVSFIFDLPQSLLSYNILTFQL